MGRPAAAPGQGQPASDGRAGALRLVFAGTPVAALPALLALLASRHAVEAVLTRPPAPAGRPRRLVPSPVAEAAAARGLPVLAPRGPAEPAFLDQLRQIAPDCCPVVAYGRLIPPAALDVPRHGWVNLHFSVLPAWRGAAPVQHALRRGDELTGATTFRVVASLDSGPVYGVVTEPIRPRDTAGSLQERLAAAGAELLVATLDGIEAGTLQACPQPSEGVSLAPKITVEDARVDWGLPAPAVDRLVRACTTMPGAWTTFRGGRLKLGPVVPIANGPDLAPGALRVAPDRVLAGTATVPVALDTVQPAGRRVMSAVEWARGVRPRPGERLG